MNCVIFQKMTSVLLVTTVLALILAAPMKADAEPSFWERQQAGIRLGSWDHQSSLLPVSTEFLKLDIGDKSFYAELFGAWRLFNRGYFEISLGFANRGDATNIVVFTNPADTTQSDTTEFYGNLVIYPVLAQFKYYLPGFTNAALKPYGQIGAGLYMGRYSIQFTNSGAYGIQEPSATKLSYVVGGGIDYQLSSSFGIEANVRYLPIKFGKTLVGASDYSTLVATVGVKYLFVPTKKKPGSKRRR